ncbi:unnamed protein product [Rotaria sp. Silwood2]|nr:unnamed protein product [Rotaria sp. Silwood2]CAF4294991.1 unnamed protein product [Rotaria sp. Silwood2]
MLKLNHQQLIEVHEQECERQQHRDTVIGGTYRGIKRQLNRNEEDAIANHFNINTLRQVQSNDIHCQEPSTMSLAQQRI